MGIVLLNIWLTKAQAIGAPTRLSSKVPRLALKTKRLQAG